MVLELCCTVVACEIRLKVTGPVPDAVLSCICADLSKLQIAELSLIPEVGFHMALLFILTFYQCM